jgi:flagellar biosynthesis protein FliP
MNITKDQIQQLSPEQQETLASVEIQHAKIRERLLKQAMGHSGMARFQVLVPALVMVFVLVPAFVIGQKYSAFPIILSIMCPAMTLWLLISYDIARINGRLDALVELLEADRKKDDHDA